MKEYNIKLTTEQLGMILEDISSDKLRKSIRAQISTTDSIDTEIRTKSEAMKFYRDNAGEIDFIPKNIHGKVVFKQLIPSETYEYFCINIEGVRYILDETEIKC